MAIRARRINGVLVALCAAAVGHSPGDIYIDDGLHHALAIKFERDFNQEGLMKETPSVGTAEWEIIDKLEAPNG